MIKVLEEALAQERQTSREAAERAEEAAQQLLRVRSHPLTHQQLFHIIAHREAPPWEGPTLSLDRG